MGKRKYGRSVYGGLYALSAYGFGRGARRVSNWYYGRGRTKKPSPYKLQRQIKNLRKGTSGSEWKTHDTATDAIVTSTATVTLLSGIAQGNTSLTRIGLKINAQSLCGRILINSNVTAGNATSWLRIMILQDKEQHGTVPAVLEILESAIPKAWKEHDQRRRWNILYDKIVNVNNYGDSNGELAKAINLKYYKKMRGRTIWYSGTTAGQADQGKGNIYLLLLGDQAVNGPTVSSNWRLRFTD